jgi:hypothetical protein
MSAVVVTARQGGVAHRERVQPDWVLREVLSARYSTGSQPEPPRFRAPNHPKRHSGRGGSRP